MDKASVQYAGSQRATGDGRDQPNKEQYFDLIIKWKPAKKNGHVTKFYSYEQGPIIIGPYIFFILILLIFFALSNHKRRMFIFLEGSRYINGALYNK